MTNFSSTGIWFATAIFWFLLSTSAAFAGGFEIIGHSQEGTGQSYVGAVTGFADGSAAHYNPGALSAIDATTVSFGGHVVPVSYNFHDQGSSVLGSSNQGQDSGEKLFVGVLPDLYIAHPLNDSLTAAFSLTSPYGLGSRYEADWVGRYQAVNSELTTIKTGASLAYAVSDALSFGATVSDIYAEAKLENAVDFGTIGLSTLGAPVATALGLAPQMNDGYATLKGHANSIGWNSGLLYRYGSNRENRLAIAYRAKTILHLKGYSHFDVPDEANVLTTQGSFQESEIETTIPLPEQLTFGVQHWVSDEVAVYLESMWNRWSRFDRLVVDFANVAQPDTQIAQNWRNSWRHGLAVRYVPNGTWEFKSGFYYDQSVITDTAFRGPILPISNEYNLGIGATYHWNDSTQIAFGWIHTFMDNASSNTLGSTGDILNGQWKGNSIDVLSLGMIYSFG